MNILVGAVLATQLALAAAGSIGASFMPYTATDIGLIARGTTEEKTWLRRCMYAEQFVQQMGSSNPRTWADSAENRDYRRRIQQNMRTYQDKNRCP